MDNNKKPSEPVEEERWALKDVPTSQLVEELVNRTGVTAESSWWCRMSSYHIIIRINLNKEDLSTVFTLKLIPILWAVIVLCNLLTKKLVPDLMTWYPIYSIIVGALTTVLLVALAF